MPGVLKGCQKVLQKYRSPFFESRLIFPTQVQDMCLDKSNYCIQLLFIYIEIISEGNLICLHQCFLDFNNPSLESNM